MQQPENTFFVKTLLYLLPACLLQTAPKATFVPSTTNAYPLSKSFFRIGDQLITLEKHGTVDTKNYVLVSLHCNEITAISTAYSFAREKGAAFYRLRHQNRLQVTADLHDETVSFDPNRIFTTWGRRVHLKNNKCLNKYAIQRVEQFARFLLAEMPWHRVIVSVNNTASRVRVTDYTHGDLEKQVKKIHINRELDALDYFLTADEEIYESLVVQNFNVVLLNRNKVKDNGSLSVYCAKDNQRFVNIETKADHVAEQERMLEAVDAILQ